MQRARIRARAPLSEPFVLTRRAANRIEVAAASREALKLGVRPGEALTAVTARLPGITAEAWDAQADTAALLQLGHWLQARMSPLVALDPPDGLFLEAEGASHLFG
ncbi:MAG: DNA polymerase Y family protein, partial [Sphingomonadaceae bacterium]